MKTVVRVKLRTDATQADALGRTLRTCNEAANHASKICFGQKQRMSAYDLQRIAYQHIKELGLSAQPAIRTIKKTVDAYSTLRANLKAGNLGKRGSKRWSRATSKPVQFRPDAAQPYDDRCLSWQMDTQTISIWTVDGRLKSIPFTGRAEDIDRLAQYRKGETDLVEHQGNFYLVATIDEPAPASFEPRGFVGVDLGIVNIATAAHEDRTQVARVSGAAVNRRREQNLKIRARIQKKGTKSGKRYLKRRSGKESRFATDVNHQISKQIVAEAQRTRRGIALEDLKGIRDRARLRKPQRARLHSWAFAQLAAFVTYKAERAGVPVVFVDPAYTSQQCSSCRYIDRKNRRTQDLFACQKCGVSLHADENAAINIATRGVEGWAAISLPNAA